MTLYTLSFHIFFPPCSPSGIYLFSVQNSFLLKCKYKSEINDDPVYIKFSYIFFPRVVRPVFTSSVFRTQFF